MRDIIVVLGGIAALVIVLTLIGGGSVDVGTGRTGPYANFGYRGPY